MICAIFHQWGVSYLRALAAQSRLDESLLAVKQVDLIHRSLGSSITLKPSIWSPDPTKGAAYTAGNHFYEK